MHIVICIKQVPDSTQIKIDPVTNTLQREGVPSIINPYDTFAIEGALALKDRFGGTVTVITMGPPQAKDALRKALSYGVDRAVLLSDRAFAGADTLATSFALSQAIKAVGESEPVDIIMCGKQSIDGDTAQVGPGIASRLGIPQLTYVLSIDDLDLDKRQIRVQRKVETGREVIVSTLPVLITMEKDVNTLRYASLKSLLKAARQDVEVWNAASVNIDPEKVGLKGSPTQVKRIFAPPARVGGEVITIGKADPAETARVLVEKLLENKTLELGE
jgi:electron transfer flavoprotein beta subunit